MVEDRNRKVVDALWLLFRWSVLCGTESRNRNDCAAGGSWALDSTPGQLPEDNLEAPEIMYQPQLGKYYLFTSYDPLMTTYNVRVAYSGSPEGPFVDFYGEDIKDTTNNVPILTAPYRFENHPGWAGTAHCGLIDAGDGRYLWSIRDGFPPRTS